MNQSITIVSQIHFQRVGRGGRKNVHKGDGPTPTLESSGRVPRVARLMALAIRFDELIQAGDATDYAELARLGHVTRARITQIMNLRMLAPDIQEAILFFPDTDRGRDPLHLRQLQPIALTPDWRKQRRMWKELTSEPRQEVFSE